jgi:hypothetical protein
VFPHARAGAEWWHSSMAHPVLAEAVADDLPYLVRPGRRVAERRPTACPTRRTDPLLAAPLVLARWQQGNRQAEKEKIGVTAAPVRSREKGVPPSNDIVHVRGHTPAGSRVETHLVSRRPEWSPSSPLARRLQRVERLDRKAPGLLVDDQSEQARTARRVSAAWLGKTRSHRQATLSQPHGKM